MALLAYWVLIGFTLRFLRRSLWSIPPDRSRSIITSIIRLILSPVLPTLHGLSF